MSEIGSHPYQAKPLNMAEWETLVENVEAVEAGVLLLHKLVEHLGVPELWPRVQQMETDLDMLKTVADSLRRE